MTLNDTLVSALFATILIIWFGGIGWLTFDAWKSDNDHPLSIFFGAVWIMSALGLAVLLTQPPETTMTLNIDEWQCTKSHDIITTRMVPSGKTFIPLTRTTTTCDQWSAK